MTRNVLILPAPQTACAVLLGALVLGGSIMAFAAKIHVVSQKGRVFAPHALTIQRGDTVEIVNDDGDLLHHAWIDADGFSFDSGDQQPGSKVDIVFTKTGVFNVLCGIHPKMKMIVTVRD